MRTAIAGLMWAGLALAQSDADTITIQAAGPSAAWSRDQVQVSLTVNAVEGTGLDAVLATVAESGMTERDLVGVGSSWPISICVPVDRGCNPSISWRFRHTGALAEIKGTFAALARLKSNAPRGMTISYSVTTTGSASGAECAYPILMSQARRHAENLAAAAGLRIGKVTAVSDGAGGESLAVRQGDFSRLVVYDPLTAASAIWFTPPTEAAGCTAVVQFQLLR